MAKNKTKLFPSLISLLFLLLSLPVLLALIQTVKYYFGKATGEPASIIVDPTIDEGPITPLWRMFAQGGEDKDPFNKIVKQIADLKPIYIRIDHLYDFYDVVKKDNNRLSFDFSKLDKVVDDILATGALPFFSLSYMPPAIAQNGNITSPPDNWNDWALTVQKTIEHYSGKNQRNLSNIIYEVWNEPDLFGDWKINGPKNYLDLYRFAVRGAENVQNVNNFKIGGPATTSLYRGWVDQFIKYVQDNNLRLDFYSWHKYSQNPEDFLSDLGKIDAWLYPKTGNSVERYITEWGSNSENSPIHDSNYDAAHLIATVRQHLGKIEQSYIFEIKDGYDPSGKKFWGRWGLLTNETAGMVEKKPKYKALELLNRLAENRIRLSGEGSWVTGFAAKDQNKIAIILSNFDPKGQHSESVPLSVINLDNARYRLAVTYLDGETQVSDEPAIDGTINKQIYLEPNRIVLIEITK